MYPLRGRVNLQGVMRILHTQNYIFTRRASTMSKKRSFQRAASDAPDAPDTLVFKQMRRQGDTDITDERWELAPHDSTEVDVPYFKTSNAIANFLETEVPVAEGVYYLLLKLIGEFVTTLNSKIFSLTQYKQLSKYMASTSTIPMENWILMHRGDRFQAMFHPPLVMLQVYLVAPKTIFGFISVAGRNSPCYQFSAANKISPALVWGLALDRDGKGRLTIANAGLSVPDSELPIILMETFALE